MANIVKVCGIGIALSLALPGYTALALTEDQPAKEEPTVKKDKPRLVCRVIRETGSRIGGSRVCKPQADWNRDSQAASQDLDDMGRASGAAPR